MLATVLAHLRPQPAIPALLLLVLTLMIALPAANQAAPGMLIAWGVPLGLLGSAGLALAAGFCSFFPPLAWLTIAWLGSASLLAIDTPLIDSALWLGTAVALAAIGVQSWRVATQRFVPTIKKGDGPT